MPVPKGKPNTLNSKLSKMAKGKPNTLNPKLFENGYALSQKGACADYAK